EDEEEEVTLDISDNEEENELSSLDFSSVQADLNLRSGSQAEKEERMADSNVDSSQWLSHYLAQKNASDLFANGCMSWSRDLLGSDKIDPSTG
ncbi:hypothetical protein OC861_006396, partial [Tilletia horrida]